MTIKTNYDPESLWQTIEIHALSELIPLIGCPDTRILPFPLRETKSGTVYNASIRKVEMVEGELVLHIRPCVVHKRPKEFLWISSVPQVFGTAVLFAPKGTPLTRYGFPYVKGARGDVEIDGVVYTTYMLHSGSLK